MSAVCNGKISLITSSLERLRSLQTADMNHSQKKHLKKLDKLQQMRKLKAKQIAEVAEEAKEEKIEITTTIKKKKRKLEAIDESVPKKINNEKGSVKKKKKKKKPAPDVQQNEVNTEDNTSLENGKDIEGPITEGTGVVNTDSVKKVKKKKKKKVIPSEETTPEENVEEVNAEVDVNDAIAEAGNDEETLIDAEDDDTKMDQDEVNEEEEEDNAESSVNEEEAPSETAKEIVEPVSDVQKKLLQISTEEVKTDVKQKTDDTPEQPKPQNEASLPPSKEFASMSELVCENTLKGIEDMGFKSISPNLNPILKVLLR
jgi:hypothetical protein